MDFPSPQPIPATPTRVWETNVPMITNRYHTDVYITDSIEEPFIYNELCHKLRSAEKGDTVTLHLNTPGGVIDSALQIMDAIKKSKAVVTASLYGTVASAGTFIALACDKLEVAPHTSWMSHNYSGGMQGKGHEMKARQEFVDKSLKDAFYDFYHGFFTEEEMQSIIDGKDYWMGREEVLHRWGNRITHLKSIKKPTSTD